MSDDASPPSAEHPLRAYRRKRDLTLETLAKTADTTKATLSRIENGEIDPSLSLMRRLIAATKGEVTAEMLIARSPATQALVSSLEGLGMAVTPRRRRGTHPTP